MTAKTTKRTVHIPTLLAALLAALAAALLYLALLPQAALGAPVALQSGATLPEAGKTTTGTVMFMGREWYVIGDGTSGLNPAGTATLLAKDSMGTSAFREGDGTASNAYADSTLQGMLERSIGQGLEADLVQPRALADVGISVVDQKIWALSAEEVRQLEAIDPDIIYLGGKTYDAEGRLSESARLSWWTRTPSKIITHGNTRVVTIDPFGPLDSDAYAREAAYGVRPAASTSLAGDDILFTSLAADVPGGSGAVKSGASANSGMLASVTKLSNYLAGESDPVYKYTVVSDKLALDVSQTAEQAKAHEDHVALTYRNASTGGSTYLSCLVTETSAGEEDRIRYYGKLARLQDASGEVSIPLKDENGSAVKDGAYKLKVFAEQVSSIDGDGTETGLDFCSEPVEFTLYVKDGKATTSNEWDITYEYQLEDGESLTDTPNNPVTFTAGSAAAKLGNPARTGYVFSGWYANEYGTGDRVTHLSDALGGPTTLYAVWDPIRYSVELYPEALGEVGDTPWFELAGVTYGSTVGEPTVPLEKEGCELTGWVTASGVPFDLAEDKVTSNLRLYPVWRHQYTVTFNVDGLSPAAGTSSAGVEPIEPQKVWESEKATKPTPDPARAGFAFKGWVTQDGRPFDFATPIIKDTQLFAQWEARQYTLTYDLDGGSLPEGVEAPVPPSSWKVAWNESRLNDMVPVREGHAFTGWFLECTTPAGNHYYQQIYASTTFSLLADWLGKDDTVEEITLKAFWAPMKDYTVVYDTGNGTAIPSRTGLTVNSAAVDPKVENPTCAGHEFAGWTCNGSNVAADATVGSLAKDGQKTITLKAQWTEVKATITYNVVCLDVDGTVTEGDGYPYGSVSLGSTGESEVGAATTAAEQVDASTGTPQGATITVRVGEKLTNGMDPYLFLMWLDDEGQMVGDPSNPRQTAMPQKNSEGVYVDATYTAYVIKNEDWPTIIYVDNLGETGVPGWETPNVNPQARFRPGEKTTLASVGSVTDENYQFSGWVIDGKTYEPGTSYTMPDHTVTAYGAWLKKELEVNFFNGYEGDPVSTQTVKQGQCATEPTDIAVPAGKTRIGWVEQDSVAALSNDGAAPQVYDFRTSVVKDTNLEALYIDTWVVTFDSAGGSDVGVQLVNNGQKAQAPDPAPTRAGYTFAGWYAQGSDVAYDFDAAVSDSLKLTAHWTENTAQLAFASADEARGSVDPASALAGQATCDQVHATAAPKPGNAFAGWYDGAGDDATLVSDKAELTLSRPEDGWVPATYYARFTANAYVVKYDSQGGSTVPDATVGWKDAHLGTAVPTREGYAFAGWYFEYREAVSTEGDATTYEKKSIPVTDATTYAELAKDDDTVAAIALTAYWTENAKPTYTVTFDSAGGSAVAQQTVVEGSSPQRPADPTRAGFTFSGWYAAGSVTPYQFDEPITGSITLTAHWIAEANLTLSYQVTGEVPEGWKTPAAVKVSAGQHAVLENPTADGYAFDGWYLGDIKFEGGSTFTVPASDVVLTGSWVKEGSYQVTFDSRGGSAVSAQAVKKGERAAKPADPTLAGYVFNGWLWGDSAYDFSEPVASDLLLTASWIKEAAPTLTVSFDPAGGTIGGVADAVVKTVGFGSKVSAPDNPEREGFTFAYWAERGAVSSPFNLNAEITGNADLVAVWRERSYAVVYDPNGAGQKATEKVAWGAASLNNREVERSGYIFNGWFFDKVVEGQAEAVPTLVVATDTFGSLAKQTADPAASSITLTASWTAVVPGTYSIVYDSDGGTMVAGMTGLDGAAKAGDVLTSDIPVRAGYRFDGWYAGEKAVTADTADTLGSLAADGSAIVTLTAHWKKQASIGTAVRQEGAPLGAVYGFCRVASSAVDPDSSYDLASNPVVVDEDLADTLTLQANLTEEGKAAGYIFACWVDAEGNALGDGADTVQVPRDGDGNYFDDTYTAVFRPAVLPFTVQYLGEGDVPLGWQAPDGTLERYEAGDVITLPLVASFEGYVCKGWNIDQRLYAPGASYAVSAADTNPIVITALWEAVVDPAPAIHTVTFSTSGQAPADWALPGQIAAQAGSIIVLPSVSAPEGYRFDGWYLNGAYYASGSEFALPGTEQPQALTFTGTWTKSEAPDPEPKPDPAPEPDPGDGPGAPQADEPAHGGGQANEGAALAPTGDGMLTMTATLMALALGSAIALAALRRASHKRQKEHR